MDEKFTLRDRLLGNLKRAKTAEKRAAIEEELTIPPLPLSRLYILGWFYELSQDREYSPSGQPLALSGDVFRNWIFTHRRQPLYADLSLLRDLDAVYLTACRKARSS